MIQYETINSSFFVANQTYCEAIENKLKTLDCECSGSCNCYGYEVLTTLYRNSLTYKLKFIKTQTPNRFDTSIYAGVEISVTGLNKRISLSFGKSLLRRYFCSNEIRNMFPRPYYLKYNELNDSIFLYHLLDRILDNNISKIILKNGILYCKINEPIVNPLKLITDIELIIKNWI